MIRRLDRLSRLAVLLPTLLLVGAGSLWAQSTAGGARGTVTDTSGAVVSNATVTITNKDTGLKQQATSDAKGEFSFPVLQPGSYRVDVTASNFKKSSKDVLVRALDTATVPVKLEVGTVEEVVTVTAGTDQVNVATGGVAQRLPKELLADFPNLNHYGFANATLMPAIGQVEERRETINAQVAGNATNRNSFYIDGAEATDPWRGWSPRQPVADAYDEIVISTAGATPDTGNNFGGTYNAVFKSGTNQFHGGGWYYFRDSGLNANSWTANQGGLAKPEDPLKYWGAQIGGPVIKDKLFFYGTMNRETDAQSFADSSYFAPTPAMVKGDFSALPFTILDPTTHQPFPGNIIPASRLDPTAQAFWAKYGYTIPNYGPNYSWQFANDRAVWNVDGRIDYNISDAHRLSVSGYWFENKTTSPDARVQSISGSSTGGTNGNTFQTGGNELSDFPQKVLNLKWTWAAKPDLFFETHGSYSDMPENVLLDSASQGTTLQSLGANDPAPRSDALAILPTMVIGQWWGSPESAVLFHGWTTDFEVKNISFGTSATWINGSHNVKVGAEFLHGNYHTKGFAEENGNGLSFNGNATSANNPGNGGFGAAFAHSFADFVLGDFAYYQVNDQSDNTLQSWNLAGYVMDQWRVSSKLTITPGLRYEFNSGISEKNNQLTMYRPGTQSTVFPSAAPGILVAGDPGLGNTLTGSFNKLAPRFNFAYDVNGDGKTAVRGSAGLYYGRDVLAVYQTAFLGRSPFSGSNAVAQNGQLSNPWLTSQNPTYSSVPLPFQTQNPANFQWGSQVSGLYQLDPNYSIASSWQWNVAVERELSKGVRLELSYQGNSSTDGTTFVPTNLAVFAPGANDNGSNVQARRPNQFLGDNGNQLSNAGRTRYDQILLITHIRKSDLFGQLSWAYTHARRNFSQGNIEAARDWDGTIDFPGCPTCMQDSTNNHTIAGFFVWNLPIARDNKILGGWSMTADGFWSFLNKGTTILTGYDANADGFSNDPANAPGSVGYPKTPINQPGSNLLYQWFAPAGFTYPDGGSTRVFSGTTTYSGVNAVSTPSYWMVNSSLMKNFTLTGSAKLQFRFEVYNLLNHANLNGPNTSLTSSDFGTIRGKYGDGRRIQMGARLMF